MKPIYVVEDDGLIRRYLRDLLERVAGWPVAEPERSEDLLRVLRKEPAALVLLDVTLPGLSLDGKPAGGVELCRRLKRELGSAAPAVVLLTAHAFAGDRERLLAESGADDYQSKPIYDEAEFLDKLRRWMQEEPGDPGSQAPGAGGA